jgi:hypothetical protein
LYKSDALLQNGYCLLMQIAMTGSSIFAVPLTVKPSFLRH